MMGRSPLTVTLILALLVVAPIAAAQSARVPTIGILAPQIPDTPLLAAFLGQLNELGYVEGRNVRIERRLVSAATVGRLPEFARELVRHNVDVIFAASPPAIEAARRATAAIPIVIETLGDPVAAGFAVSLNRPGHNVTGSAGLDPQLTSKRLELIKETVSGATRAAVMRNPTNPTSPSVVDELERTAKTLRITLRHVEVRQPAELEGAFDAMVRDHVNVLVMISDPLFSAERARIVALAAKAHLPAVYGFSGMAEIGGLMVYGPSHAAMYRDAAAYVVKILEGSKPGDLPIQRPTKFELMINMKTAKSLGLRIPPSLLLRADRIIE